MTKDGNTLGMYLIGEDVQDRIVETLGEAKKRESKYKVLSPPMDWEKKNALDELEELA